MVLSKKNGNLSIATPDVKKNSDGTICLWHGSVQGMLIDQVNDFYNSPMTSPVYQARLGGSSHLVSSNTQL